MAQTVISSLGKKKAPPEGRAKVAVLVVQMATE